MSGGITTINGGTVQNNFTTGPAQPVFVDGFNIGTIVTSIFGSGAFSVGGSTGFPSTTAVTGNGIASTITGATTIAFQGNNDTLTAAGTQPYTALLGQNSVLNEGAGSSTVYGSTFASTVNAGTGSTTIVGGSGSLTFNAGPSSSDSVTAGSGMNTLNGGTGGSNTLVGGSGGTQINLTGASTGDHVVGGTGVTVVDASQTTGNLEVDTNPSGTGTTEAVLGTGADSFIGGGGTSYVAAGSGADVFGFVQGTAGGTEYIFGYNAKDNIAFQGYGYSATNPPTENVVNGTDIIKLGDGTTIYLVDYGHKLF